MLFTIISAPILAQSNSQSNELHRKKVGVVLSGGGAKGVAHIGILKVLEEAGIPIDYIAGTSMGSIVGGLYAIGYSPAALDSIMQVQDWIALLGDRVSRGNMFLTEKEISDKALITVPFDEKNFRIATGILSGEAVMNMLTEYTIGYHNMKSFDDLPIPFACVAYDLISGKEVVMRDGNLAQAIRASMSIPGAFATVERDNHMLIDGGIINNYPVDVIREMGAEIVIGVDVGMIKENAEVQVSGDLPESERNSLTFMITTMMERLGSSKFEQNIALTDLYIHPNIDGYSTASFTSAAIDSLLMRGQQAGEDHLDEILALKERIGLTANEPYVLPGNRNPNKETPLPQFLRIADIHFTGLSSFNSKNLYRMLRFKENENVTVEEIHEAINRLKGTGFFSSLGYRMTRNEDRPNSYDLVFECKERARSSISIGVRFDSEDIAAGYFNLAYAPQELNGAMIEASGRLSSNAYANIGLYYQDAWVGKFGLSYRYRYGDLDFYTPGDTSSTHTTFHLHRINMDMANFYFRNFNFYLGTRFEMFRPKTYMLGQNGVATKYQNENLIIYQAGVRYDSFDEANFPTKGVRFKSQYTLFTDDFAHYKDDAAFYALSASLYGAVSTTERLTFVPGIYGRFVFGEQLNPLYQNYVGGSMSGRYLEHQMPFYGFTPTAITDKKFAAIYLEARYRIGNSHYVWVKGNLARINETVIDMIEWVKGSYMAGAAFGYSYNTPLGPLDLMVTYGLHPGAKYGFYINLGKYF